METSGLNMLPHRLELYQHAVQQPGATAALLQRMHRRGLPAEAEPGTLLREDFAGTAAVAAAWVEMHPDHQALAVEHHGPTFRWAQRRHRDLADLHLIEADVMDLDRPRVDITAALNFSTFGYHSEADLLAYLRHARRGLRPRGVLVLDAYGGPGAQRPATQTRPADGFTYQWQQLDFDPLSHRTRCRIHFTLDGGREIRNAFRYDWRLWTLPELFHLLRQAGYRDIQTWSQNPRGRTVRVRKLPVAEDWTIYIVAQR